MLLRLLLAFKMFINVSMYIEAAYYKFKFKLLQCELRKNFTGKYVPQSKVRMKNGEADDIQFFFNNFHKQKGQKNGKKGFVLSFLVWFCFFCVTHIQRSSGLVVRHELSIKEKIKSKYTATKRSCL